MRKRRKYVPVTDVGYLKTIIVTYRYVGNFFCKKRKNYVREGEKENECDGRRNEYGMIEKGKERKICKRERENEYDVRRND